MRYRWPVDTAFTQKVLTVEQEHCSACQGPLHICDHRFHRIFSLQGPLELVCKLVRCPNCQYEFPERPESIGLLQRLFHRPQAAPAHSDSVPLSELNDGESSELVCLNCTQISRRNALAVFGLVPGSRLILQQKRPSFVVRVGETELALDGDIAREILVRRSPE